jgi:hypothetical protein
VIIHLLPSAQRRSQHGFDTVWVLEAIQPSSVNFGGAGLVDRTAQRGGKNVLGAGGRRWPSSSGSRTTQAKL